MSENITYTDFVELYLRNSTQEQTGAILFELQRLADDGKVKCASCGSRQAPENEKCTNCGHALKQDVL